MAFLSHNWNKRCVTISAGYNGLLKNQLFQNFFKEHWNTANFLQRRELKNCNAYI